ncbi:MAG TPA: nitrogenase component 1 [Elusimicrobiales bacterium]|nr:nitrogenase component 1 [Elusimicrobiales bacterium]
MKNAAAPEKFRKTYDPPYLLGVYLAVNAVPDAAVMVDGPSCVITKADYIAGNHDLHSTLLSCDGRHRVMCTVTSTMPQPPNPEDKLSALLESAAGSGLYGVVLLTGLPFMRLIGMDYEGIASRVRSGAPVAVVPPLSLEGDWLDGYAKALDALVSALPVRRVRKRRRSAVIAGYLFDRNERDHSANISGLKRLLAAAGVDLLAVLPGGKEFKSWERAREAELVISMPYGRQAAARLAAMTGARLVETGLPVGIGGTSAWLASVRAAAGLKGPLPPVLAELERATRRELAPAQAALAHHNIVFAGDPYLYSALRGFALELCMRVPAAFIGSLSRPLSAPGPAAKLVMFAPEVAEAAEALAALGRYDRPHLGVCDSLAITAGLTGGVPAVELGFPSYAHHCLSDEPFMGYEGARSLAGRLLNALQSAEPAADRGR